MNDWEVENSFSKIGLYVSKKSDLLDCVSSRSDMLEQQLKEALERIEKLEMFLEKIKPLLPDDIKLFLEVEEGEK